MAVEQARQRMKEQKLWQTPRRETSRLGVAPFGREKSKIDLKERDELLDKIRPHVSFTRFKVISLEFATVCEILQLGDTKF